MTKEQVLEILKLMDCEIAQVKINFERNGHVYNTNVLVYLVSDPSNEDQIQIIMSNHWCIFYNINEFYKDIENRTSTQVEFIMVSEFVSDFKNEIAVPYQKVEEKTVQWYKVNSSMLKDEFGVILWKDLIDFMSHTIGFDYTITGQYTKPYTGVEISYENGQFVKL